jgi:hypothetical protein
VKQKYHFYKSEPGMSVTHKISKGRKPLAAAQKKAAPSLKRKEKHKI